MPSQRRVSDEYYQLFYKARADQFAFVKLSSAQEARNLRSYLYHFRRKLREDDHELAAFASEVKFLIHPDGLELQVRSAPGADAIRKAL